MFFDRNPFSSCIDLVNVAFVWQLLIFPLSGKCWIVIEMIVVVKIPITYNFKDLCQTKSN